MTLTTHRRTHDGEYSEALDYDRLKEPWHQWAKIASSFILQLDDQQDREDLLHDIIVRLAEIAEEYRLKGKPLTKWGCIRVAQYTRLRFYHQKKRWRRVSSINLNSPVRDEDGNETELINTLADQKRVDLDALIDAKSHYLNSPERMKQAIRKRVNQDWHTLSGYDWKLIRRFREEAKQKVVVG